MISGVISLLGPIILWGLKKWMETQALTEQQMKNYYSFLEDIDKHTKVDVTNYIAAGDAREATIERIRRKRIELGIDEKAKKID